MRGSRTQRDGPTGGSERKLETYAKRTRFSRIFVLIKDDSLDFIEKEIDETVLESGLSVS